ncbi:MAG: hypothetical protein ACLFWD_07875 [Anaerolineales bacterium]
MSLKSPDLKPLEIGGGRVTRGDTSRLHLPTIHSGYADAQLDDHRQLARSELPWRPPLQFIVEARTDKEEPVGTLGFGFWNDPFAFSFGQAGAARKLPASPNALWFFYGSPPNDLALQEGAPPCGWKASSLRTPRLPSLLLAGPALAALGLSYLPGLRSLIVGAARSIISAAESGIDGPLERWRRYRIEWRAEVARFWVQNEMVLEAGSPPQGPLGLVLWIDNQYAVLSKSKGIKFGTLSVEEPQTLEIRKLSIETID